MVITTVEYGSVAPLLGGPVPLSRRYHTAIAGVVAGAMTIAVLAVTLTARSNAPTLLMGDSPINVDLEAQMEVLAAKAQHTSQLAYTCANDVPATSGMLGNPQDFVDETNAWRREVGAQDVSWDPKLADLAQKWADNLKATNNCKMSHSTQAWRQSTYGAGAPLIGENLAWSACSGCAKAPAKSGKAVVMMWAAEKASYIYGPYGDTCTTTGGVTGHYVAMVMAKTTKMGCALANCGAGTNTGVSASSLWVCHYAETGYLTELPTCQQGMPADMNKCTQAQIDNHYGPLPPCRASAGSCTPGQCCSCACGQGAAAMGAVLTPPPPGVGMGANNKPCVTEELGRCEGERCCAAKSNMNPVGTDTVCMLANDLFGMCMNPKFSWTFCPGGPKYSGVWACMVANVDGTSTPWSGNK